tara:strand:+ start:7292 stop:7969 length:678 start_codon:yes stop_codon:yes gene_type:complete
MYISLYSNMVKNVKGGKKGKKIARKSLKEDEELRKKIRYSENELEMYGRVTHTYGHGMANVLCGDKKERNLIIRKKFKGRNRRGNIVQIGKIVLCGIREWSSSSKKEKVDLLYVYDKWQWGKLKKQSDFNTVVLIEDYIGNNEEELGISFDAIEEEEEEKPVIKKQVNYADIYDISEDEESDTSDTEYKALKKKMNTPVIPTNKYDKVKSKVKTDQELEDMWDKI